MNQAFGWRVCELLRPSRRVFQECACVVVFVKVFSFKSLKRVKLPERVW